MRESDSAAAASVDNEPLWDRDDPRWRDIGEHPALPQRENGVQ